MSDKLTCEHIYSILSKRFEGDRCRSLSELPPPHLFKDMQKASTRIAKAIKDKEKITIVGDYDVDGVVSTAILSEFFSDIGYEVEIIIPNRFIDGYGLSPSVVERIDSDLVITVDNGISAVESALVLKKRGVDLIITDHHNIPQTLPQAYAIINPKQEECPFPYEGICGAQVAWYLVASLKSELSLKRYDLTKFLDILSIAIMADMMELKGINRTMVKRGFHFLNHSKRAFLEAIKRYFNKKRFKSDDISFLIAPLLNSAGRLEDASVAFDFIKSRSLDEAMAKLEHLIALNNQRKEIERDITAQAIKKADSDQKIIVVWSEDWHEGVVGIVAARLCRRFGVPAIVMTVNGDKAKGSARSVGDVDILSLIATQKEKLLGFGGHKSAAGLMLEADRLEEFKSALELEASKIDDEKFIDNSHILGEIEPKAINSELISILEEFEPYGVENPQPKFTLSRVKVENGRVIGMSANHLKMHLVCNDVKLKSIYFNFDKTVKEGDEVDIVCSVTQNEFRGEKSLVLTVERMTISGDRS